jgi:hypothetical protein
VTERPNDLAAELSNAPVLAENTSARIRGTASTGRIDGKAAHPDVASFIAARAAAAAATRAAAAATPELADGLGTNGHAGPAPPLDPPPRPEPVSPELPPRPEARPRIVEDPVILGLTRVSRSRLGSRLFVWFFVFVYAVILIQLVVSLLQT